LARLVALETLGLIAARRGETDAAAWLDEAMSIAEPTGQLLRMGPVRAARAQAALLVGDVQQARAELNALRDLVFSRGHQWQRGEFAWLLHQCGETDLPTVGIAAPYALLLAGDYGAAADIWQELGCPYEAARARAASDDPALVRQAIATFEALNAKPALAMAIHHLRELGVRDLPTVRRGPRSTTRANPAGLTQREAEVLALAAAGLRNAEIGARLFLSPKTVGHHLSSIYAKLGVATRADAARVADQLGITAT
jgi:DNA-binding CsgD family transcriptional regulator